MAPRTIQHARLLDIGFAIPALGWLAEIPISWMASCASLLWFVIQIWESTTGQHWRGLIRRFLIRKGPF